MVAACLDRFYKPKSQIDISVANKTASMVGGEGIRSESVSPLEWLVAQLDLYTSPEDLINHL